MVRLFIDFDGTITHNDVSDELFITYGQHQPIHTQLHDGEMSVYEYYERSAAMLHPECTADVVQKFAESQDADTGFVPLVSWCDEHSIPVYVVSDGFDSYIYPVLNKLGVRELPVFSNTLQWQHTEQGMEWVFGAPGATESCTCFCASCKRNAIINSTASADIVIYIGDGRSDACAVEHADVVFAKGYLARYCTENGIPHHPFRTLHDVLHICKTLHRKQRLTPRRQAQLARNRAIMAE